MIIIKSLTDNYSNYSKALQIHNSKQPTYTYSYSMSFLWRFKKKSVEKLSLMVNEIHRFKINCAVWILVHFSKSKYVCLLSGVVVSTVCWFVIASFPSYATIPTTTNQTLLISQVALGSSQPNILPAHSAKQDMQKVSDRTQPGVTV
jgi:hypothetical protein